MLSLGFLLFILSSLFAQKGIEWDAAKIKLQMEKLNTLGTVLYVAAHPDDENTTLITWLSNEKKYRTAYLSLNRGSGGQNLIGDEQGADLGVIRTEELLAARAKDGGEQFFTHAIDFGFSKTAKETLEFWGHDRILSDVVWLVRKFRPDVLICRFPEDTRAGHGNHWSSAILAHEAFSAASDPTKFPDQLKYVSTWQPKRIVWDVFNFRGMNLTEPDQFKIDIGGYNPLLGQGYGEIAAESRSMHKSQGMGSTPAYGEQWAYFKTIAGPEPKSSLMDGVNTSWSGIADGKVAGSLIQKALDQYESSHPEKSLSLLFEIKQAIRKLSDTSLMNYKEKQVDDLIFACSGILLNAISSNRYVVAGEKLSIRIDGINRSQAKVMLNSIKMPEGMKEVDRNLNPNQSETLSYLINVPQNTPISQPYWLMAEPGFAYYNFNDQLKVGKPMNTPSIEATFNLTINGNKIALTRPVLYKYTDPVRGEIFENIVVAPPVTANIKDEVYVFTEEKARQVDVTIKGFKSDVKGVAHLDVPAGFIVKNNDQPFFLKNAEDEEIISFTMMHSGPVISASNDSMTVRLDVGDAQYNRGFKRIALTHVPAITLFPITQSRLASIPLLKGKGGHQIGYIMGAGDKVPDALVQMGYNVHLLSDKDLSSANLALYDAIIVGIRGYNTRTHLKHVRTQLMDYVKNGGSLVVQYNTNQGLVTDSIGPYPFKVFTKRVTDETSPVKFLLPNDPIVNYPNKITQDDFKGWVQERGLYFVENVDGHYRKPFAMQDPEEDFQDGSLIVTNFGKGKFVYTSLDFFRQLPAGVPGAFRLLVNLFAK